MNKSPSTFYQDQTKLQCLQTEFAIFTVTEETTDLDMQSIVHSYLPTLYRHFKTK